MTIDDWNLIFYSMIYTAVPCMTYGVFEQPAPPPMLLRHPTAYRGGPACAAYNGRAFLLTMADTAWQALAIFFVPVLGYAPYRAVGLRELGCLHMTALTLCASLHIAIDTRHWTLPHAAAVALSFLAYVLLTLYFDASLDTGFGRYWIIYHGASDGEWWLVLLLSVVAALLPHTAARAASELFRPSVSALLRELARLEHRLRRRVTVM